MTKSWKAFALLAAFVLVVAACGDDSGSDTSPGAQSSPADSSSTAEPQVGGELTILMWNEIAGLDPNLNSPSSGASGSRDFALYGALLVQPSGSSELEPLLAESLTVDDTHRVWTLRLREGITFSDGTPFDAEAVMVNWQRIQTPEVRSPAYGYSRAISSMTVVDPLTLRIELSEPNVVFDRTVSRSALNYIASAAAIRSGHDLSREPIGAGPFLLESWIRDDRMVLVRNPDWFEAPRPYLDRITFRVVTDEEQRLDTLFTGGADASYTTNPESVRRAEEEGVSFVGTDVGSGTVLNFNTSQAPFDDVRVRRLVTVGVDFQAMLETVQGPSAVAAENFTVEGAPWFTDDAAVPPYDLEEATALAEEYLAETGASTLELTLHSGPNHIPMAKFVQTSLNQIPNVNVTVEQVDQPTLIQKSYAHEFGMAFWGYPTINPDPDLYQGVFGGLSTNSMAYDSPDVNAALTQARSTADADGRAELYADMFTTLAEDLPFRPVRHGQNGWLYSDDVANAVLYSDGILRFDLVGRS